MEKLRTWREFLIEQLADPEEALGYLQVSLEEYLVDGDTFHQVSILVGMYCFSAVNRCYCANNPW